MSKLRIAILIGGFLLGSALPLFFTWYSGVDINFFQRNSDNAILFTETIMFGFFGCSLAGALTIYLVE